jgi:2,3-bisphosphoglycerate-dependent phosphoglycerate mutase
MCPARLVLVRHGESEDNTGPFLSSVVPGLSLTPAGLEQARETARSLTHDAVAHVYSSPLRRARETADVLADDLGLRVTEVDELREFSLGVHEGTDRETAMPPVDEMFLGWLLEGSLERRLDGGESGREVVDRFSAAVSDIADTHRGQTVAVVSHGGTLALGATVLCANLRPVFARDHPLDYCDTVVMEWDGDMWRAISWAGEPLD